MRTTLALDDELLKEAQHLTGTTEKTAVVRQAWVTGELGLGSLSRRAEVLGLLHNLPQATVATDVEAMSLIDHKRLFGLGIGYVDAHLLASTRLSDDARLWTRDTRLHASAVQIGLEYRDARVTDRLAPPHDRN